MPHLSAEAKHHILLEYSPRSTTHSFEALARRHAIAGGKRTVLRWHARWNGTPQSLMRSAGSGKARILSRVEVSRHIRAPILAANRAHRAVHYPDLLPRVQAAGTQLSLRTLQRYGKKELSVKQKRGVKRTSAESEYIHSENKAASRMFSEHGS